jgi:hypothetical protein
MAATDLLQGRAARDGTVFYQGGVAVGKRRHNVVQPCSTKSFLGGFWAMGA